MRRASRGSQHHPLKKKSPRGEGASCTAARPTSPLTLLLVTVDSKPLEQLVRVGGRPRGREQEAGRQEGQKAGLVLPEDPSPQGEER